MKSFPGFFPPKSSQVCLLKEFLYGLKQAIRQWYAKLAGALSFQGYSSFVNDYSLFFSRSLVALHPLLLFMLMPFSSLGMPKMKFFLSLHFLPLSLKSKNWMTYTFLGIDIIRE